MTAPTVSSRGRNLALLAALLGWMFDGMEMGLFPLVGNDALRELLGDSAPQSEVDNWFKIVLACFLVGAATGGVVFGWLGDKIGRVRAMTVSVLLYSLCSGLSAASPSPTWLAALRFLGALGMGGEWTLGVALVMELWPNKSRAWLAGWIGAFGNFGYAICGSIAFALNKTQPGELQSLLANMGLPTGLAASLTAHGYWRLLMLVGAVPALMTLFIRLFVPESEKWLREKSGGAASYWSERDLIGVLVGAAAACGVIVLWGPLSIDLSIRIAGSIVGLFVVIYGYLVPVRGYLSRCGFTYEAKRETLLRMLLAAGISGVPLLGTWAGLMWMYQWVPKLPNMEYFQHTDQTITALKNEKVPESVLLKLNPLKEKEFSRDEFKKEVDKFLDSNETQEFLPVILKDCRNGKVKQVQEAKAVLQIISSVAAALGCVIAALLGGRFGRRPVYAALCVLSLLSMVGFYRLNTEYGLAFLVSGGVLSFVSAAFYGWLPLYLPELFRTSVRATGQGFGFNFGRIIAAAGNLQMSNLLAFFGEDYAKACAVVAGVYVVGLVLIALAPETKGKPLPE
jgi:SHS family sialic acid transporter-like MFS transporter